MSQPYLDLARQGKNHWWRYALSIIVILGFWLFLGGLPIIALVVIGLIRGTITPNDTNPIEKLGAFDLYAAILLGFIPLFIGLFLSVRFIHGRRVMTLITPLKRPIWKRFWLGFGVWTLLVGLASLVEAWLYPGRYQFTFMPAEFLAFLVVGLALIPIQSGTEELLFRGYILQSLGLKVRNPVILSIMNGLFFWLPHLGNPEVEVDFWLVSSMYVTLGIFFTAITLRSQGLELALGAHIANNLFMTVVASYPAGALPASAFFTVTTLDPVYGLASLLVSALLFYGIIFIGFRRWFEQGVSTEAQPEN